MDVYRLVTPEIRDRDPLFPLKDANSNFISTFLLRIASSNASCFASQSKSSDWTGLKIREAAGGTQGRHYGRQI